MLMDDTKKYLKDTFGVSEYRKCKNCVLVSNCPFIRSNETKCCLKTHAEWFNIMQLRDHSEDERVNKFIQRLEKIAMLGYDMVVDDPWLLFKRDGATKIWMNPSNRTWSATTYSKIVVYNDFLLCSSDKLEVFTVPMGSIDILKGIEDITKNIKKFINRGVDKTLLLFVVDNNGKDFGLLLNRYGDRVLMYVPGGNFSIYRQNPDCYMLNSYESNSFIRLDNRLNVISKSTDMVAIRV